MGFFYQNQHSKFGGRSSEVFQEVKSWLTTQSFFMEVAKMLLKQKYPS